MEVAYGTVFHRWTVIGTPFIKQTARPYLFVLCRCECGSERPIRVDNLKHGATKSCGCLNREVAAAKMTTHGETHSRLYNTWCSMKQRCYDQKNKRWDRYGGRGITLCAEWMEFERFREWAHSSGYSEGLSIDRIDNDGNYCPENCRWATITEQANNTSTNHIIHAFGESKTLSNWTKDPRCVATRSLLGWRISAGWNPEDAITRRKRKCASQLPSLLTN